MENAYQFRAGVRASGGTACHCGKCHKVKAILDGPLGHKHTEAGLRAMSNDRLVELVAAGITAKPTKRKATKRKASKPEANPYLMRAAAPTTGLDGEPPPVDPGLSPETGYPLPGDPYNLDGLAALRKARQGGER